MHRGATWIMKKLSQISGLWEGEKESNVVLQGNGSKVLSWCEEQGIGRSRNTATQQEGGGLVPEEHR